MQSPYQPTTQFSAFPPVIKNLLILNGLVFLASLVPTTAALLTQWFGLWPLGDYPDFVQTMRGLRRLGDFYPWQIVTYGFLHGGFTHILFNMFALWMFGAAIENAWGSRRFGIYYFVCLVGAGLVQLAVTTFQAQATGFPVPTIGASGAVFGILLAFGMMYPETPIYLYFFFPIKAKYFVILYGILELWSGFANTNSGVAHFAHLAGMAFGFVLILYWRGKLPVKPRQTLYW